MNYSCMQGWSYFSLAKPTGQSNVGESPILNKWGSYTSKSFSEPWEPYWACQSGSSSQTLKLSPDPTTFLFRPRICNAKSSLKPRNLIERFNAAASSLSLSLILGSSYESASSPELRPLRLRVKNDPFFGGSGPRSQRRCRPTTL
jgi:hypothetical protein